MARCERCWGCQSMWDTKSCEWCGFPGLDTRTEEQKAQNDADYEEFMSEEEFLKEE